MSAAKVKTWSTTGKDRLNPQPLIYPVCATCATPWAYKWVWAPFSGRAQWLWVRDCKHKIGAPVMHGQDPEPEEAAQ